jgi:pyruvate/2-oxoacid:ferredoxin oxidoreductase alpha subunit
MMNTKRFLKVEAMARETRGWFRAFGHEGAPRGLIAWGSQYGMLREWVVAHPEYRVFMPEILSPFPLEALAEWRQGLEWTAVLELSYQGQLHRYLSSLADLRGVHSLTRSGGVPLTHGELGRLLGQADSRSSS